MKKLLSITIVTLFLAGMMLSLGAAFADEMAVPSVTEAPVGDALTPEEESAPAAGAYTLKQLGTIAGATAATLMIVQFLKLPLDRVWKIPTRIFVYFIALLVTLVSRLLTGDIGGSDIFLIFINAFVIALAAMGSYEMTFAKLELGKKK